MREIAQGRCEWCGIEHAILHTHHIHYRTLGDEEPQDLIVLCDTCHADAHDNWVEPIASDLAAIACNHPDTFQEWLAMWETRDLYATLDDPRDL